MGIYDRHYYKEHSKRREALEAKRRSGRRTDTSTFKIATIWIIVIAAGVLVARHFTH